jgi:hypothetical protein
MTKSLRSYPAEQRTRVALHRIDRQAKDKSKPPGLGLWAAIDHIYRWARDQRR